MTDLASLMLEMAAQAAAWKQDPLRYRLFSSDVTRQATRHLASGLETYVRSGNKGGKTEWGAAMLIAIARGVPTLDGRTLFEAARNVEPWQIELPRCRVPNVQYLSVAGYKPSMDSSIAAVRAMLGEWDHEEVKVGGDTVGVIYVRPDSVTSTKRDRWSKVVVHADSGTPGEGPRLDGVWGDEHQTPENWTELRFRGRAGEPLFRWLTLTAKERARWFWLTTTKGFKGCLNRPHNGRIELQMNAFDNQALSADDRKQMLLDAQGDPLWRARLYGEYVDSSGACPFQYSGLQRWRQRCWAGRKWELDERVEVWFPGEANERFFVIGDPSGGIRDDDGKHDAAGIWVIAAHARVGCARFRGFVNSIELGRLMRKLYEWYGPERTLLVPLVTGGYADALLHGIGEGARIWRNKHRDNQTGRATRPGWIEGKASKQTCVAMLQAAIKDDTFTVPSLEAVESLMAVTMDVQDRVVDDPGKNLEDLVLLGTGLDVITRVPEPESRRVQPPPKDFAEYLRREGMGREPEPAWNPPDAW